MSSPLSRLSDKTYLGHLGLKNDIKLEVKCRFVDAESAYCIAEKALLHLKHNFQTHHFRYGGVQWKIHRRPSFSWMMRILHFFQFKLFHIPSSHEKKHFTITPIKKVKKQLKFQELNYKTLKKTTSLSHEDYLQGVRGIASFESKSLKPYCYDDPFTFLATQGFSRFDPHFFAEDKLKPHASCYRLVKRENELLLVHKESILADKNALKGAHEKFLSQIKELYGEEKVLYIDKLYKLKLFSQDEITPEQVYRFNIGTTNLELNDLAKAHPTLSELTENELNTLIESTSPSDEALERAYTGKKITTVIQSAYTLAELKTYKPWIDQQELTQTCAEIKKGMSFNAYFELLSHIIVKKHLAREYPKGSIRLGALIPAPPLLPGGEVRWYYVAECTTNKYIYSYTLQPVLKTSTLPVIKLYRNTAISPYALYSKASIVNSFSHLNPPGYMGISMLDGSDGELAKKHSIPLWYGYALAARQQKDEKKALESLKKALQCYEKAQLSEETHENMRGILRAHDVILNELFMQKKFYDRPFGRHFEKLVLRYIQLKNGFPRKIKLEIEKQDAKALINTLQRLKGKGADEREERLINALVHDLEIYLSDKKPTMPEKDPFYFECERLIEAENPPVDAILALFDNRASELGEDLLSKSQNSLALGGHSLGGSVGQIALVRYFAKWGRLPLPGKELTLFEFDATGITKEDNSAFKRYGKKHGSLFASLDVRFHLFRRQEVFDFVAGTGEEHLGACFSDDEKKTLESWLSFDASILERLKSSSHPEIAEAGKVHMTRFQRGKKAFSFFETEANAQADYQETHFDPKIQALFNTPFGFDGMDLKKSKELHYHLKHKVWKLPTGPFRQILTEKMRLSAHFIALRIRKLFMPKNLENREFPKKFQDSVGSVHLKGA